MQDLVERRKRLNRDRQKAWRDRQKAARRTEAEIVGPEPVWQGHGILKATSGNVDCESQHITHSISQHIDSCKNGSHKVIVHQTSKSVPDNGSLRKGSLIPPLLPYTTDADRDQPTISITFPLSPDHHLITLVQYNVVRALIHNMSMLSLVYCLPQQCSRAFGISDSDPSVPQTISQDLQPTLLQQTTPHPFWISAIPFPAMRDNLILMAGNYDHDDLCYDLGQALYEGFDDVERRGFLVWGQPWQMSGWEVTEGFVKKWGFLLKGCNDVVESANRWRDVRGEDWLIVEI